MMAYMRTAVSLIGFGFAIFQFLYKFQNCPSRQRPLSGRRVVPGTGADLLRRHGGGLLGPGVPADVRYLWSGGYAAVAGMTSGQEHTALRRFERAHPGRRVRLLCRAVALLALVASTIHVQFPSPTLSPTNLRDVPPLPANGPPGFHLLAKPSGSTCNIDCTYCFFLSKEALYPNDKSRMSEATLEAYIRQLLESHRTPQVTVAWQGGEPTLMKLDFFRRAVELVEKYRRPGQTVQHTFQTNGLLLDDDWCAFFKQHNFLVGLSVDGPRELHDTYRVDRRGQGTFDLVMRGWRYLRKHGVDFNILCTVNAANQHHGRAVYRFFRDELGAKWVQFIPIIERATEQTIEHRQQGLERAGRQEAPALHADRQPGDRAHGRRRAVRPLPDRHLRGVGAPRRGPGVRAALRRHAGGLLRPPPAVHPRARPAATARRWSTTAISTPAITSSSRSTSSATSTRRTCSSWWPRPSSASSARTSATR